jgi:hypothetical protein
MNGTLKLLVGLAAATVATAGVALAATADLALAAASPAVTTGSTSSIKTTSAVLHGTVNPNGASTTYHFEWGLTNAYGTVGAAHSAGSGTAAVSVQFTAPGLTPGTPYHYRLVAQNRFGTTFGADRHFTTGGNPPPDVLTGGTAQVGATSAILTGEVNPHGQQTSFWFQYGLGPAYGYQTFPQTVAAGNALVPVAQTLQGIAPLTVFHYRLVAQHGNSAPNVGVDMTFLTQPAIRLRPRIRARTTPHRARKAPFVFTTSGSRAGPSNIPPALGCAQSAVVKFLFGRGEWSSTTIPIQPNCTFSGQTTIHHLPGRGKKHRTETLRVIVTAVGSGYFAPVSTRPSTVVLGG